MSRQVFNSNNKVGQTITLRTNSWSGYTNPSNGNVFDPDVQMVGSKRLHWDLGEGNGYTATNNLSHVYNDTGTTKTVVARTQLLKDITRFSVQGCGIVGELDLRGISLETSFLGNGNPQLTAVTHSYSDAVISVYQLQGISSPTQAPDITGNHDLSMFPNLGGQFIVRYNDNLTGITHTYSPQIFTSYNVQDNNLTGTHDVSMLTLGGSFQIQNNNNLTGIIHTASTEVFTNYSASGCDLRNLDVSMFPNLGGTFDLRNNPNITAVTHTYSPQIFTSYRIARVSVPSQDPNLIGVHDVSMFPNLGGTFTVAGSPNLTGITHTASTQPFTLYQVWGNNLTGEHNITMLSDVSGTITFYNNSNLTAFTATPNSGNVNAYRGYNCNITGNHDMSIYPNLGGDFQLYNNPNLTGVTHTASTRVFTEYHLNNCNIIGNHDLTMFPNLGGQFRMYNNPNLTGITHTASTQPISYSVGGCDITGNHDVSMLDLNFNFGINNNPNLTGVTFNPTGSTNNIKFEGYDCDLRENFDISQFINLNRKVNIHNNPNLTGVTLPISTNDFYNDGTGSQDVQAFGFNLTSIKYVDFHPLSGATLNGFNDGHDTTINLSSNSMTAGEVNRMLVELSGITFNNYAGWSGTTLTGASGDNIVLQIGGGNAAPDSSSGGYDGLAALAYLTGATPTGAGWDVSIT